jgi:hypothetical protein
LPSSVAQEEGWPPYRRPGKGAVYVRMPFGLEPYDPHWHYCPAVDRGKVRGSTHGERLVGLCDHL